MIFDEVCSNRSGVYAHTLLYFASLKFNGRKINTNLNEREQISNEWVLLKILEMNCNESQSFGKKKEKGKKTQSCVIIYPTY